MIEISIPEIHINNTIYCVLSLIPIVFLMVTIIMLLYYKSKQKKPPTKAIEYYPPQEFNSLEAGFLYNGQAGTKDVTSLLLYLANKGYMKISEVKEKSLFRESQQFKITKLKEYDGNNTNERMFLNGLFKTKTSDVIWIGDTNEKDFPNTVNEVILTDLYDNFYSTMTRIIYNINNKNNRSKIFDKSALNKKIPVLIMIVVAYCLVTILPLLTQGTPSKPVLLLLLLPIIWVIILTKTTSTKAIYRAKPSKMLTDVFITCAFIVLWAVIVFPILIQNPMYFVWCFIGIMCIIGMFICLKFFPTRTTYGSEILGELEGLKNFLETAEKDKLKSIAIQNPTYLYDVLPYAYILGVSDKLIQKFETIPIQAPQWYNGSSGIFDIKQFKTFVKSEMNVAEKVMSSKREDTVDD